MKKIIILSLIFIEILSCTKEDVIPTTLEESYKIKTIIPEYIDMTYFNAGGIIDTSLDSIKEIGVCCDVNPIPTRHYRASLLDLNKNMYKMWISHLTPNTNYYTRAYFVKNNDTFYGKVYKFKTFSKAEKETGALIKGGVIYRIPNPDRNFYLTLITTLKCDIVVEWDKKEKFYGAELDNYDYSGLINSNKIIANIGYDNNAVFLASKYTENGIGDWHLPCISEMVSMTNVKDFIGTIDSNQFYWTSNEVDAKNAWAINLYTNEVKQFDKRTRLKIKPIKYF